ncbi:uncharacterized protein H6S33_008872 [Morchella sextelata]|uniref:uncharacterized protein n=1 Tax=Morchella sextelata TaxID=1174677 RepID=UPI001D042899|nr:uncharacterized protein H6S33_008872 [Morchella sextelata]KAH0612492.1 hypothetical protein H6S33_008872 [Morchella sextelata]
MHIQEKGTVTSIRERVQTLQLEEVSRHAPQYDSIPPAPSTTKGTPRLPPRPPARPASSSTVTTTTRVTTTTSISVIAGSSGVAKKQAPPPLPRRKTSISSMTESIISVTSTSSNNSHAGSTSSTRALPPIYTGKDSLPVQFHDKKITNTPLPPKRINSLPAPRPTPPLPTRRTTTAIQEGSRRNSDEATVVPRRLPPPPVRNAAPPISQRPPLPASHTDSAIGSSPPPIPRSTRPPPIPVSSRPSSGPSCKPHTASTLPCLICYDYSGPDHHASLPQFQRSQVRSLQTLAIALTSPFPSALEKARVIFTWLHHNISYDVRALLAGNIPDQSPESTIRTGLSVCAGYSNLFEILCTYSGLQCVVVTGHGKGFGHTDPAPGAPVPSYNMNHAWNAVKLSSNHWHLIDSCWGAGHRGSNNEYKKEFAPEHFISPASVFGQKHFPEKPGQQYREDGRTISWEEYILSPEPPKLYKQFTDLFNFSKETVSPSTKRLQPGTRTRFAVSLPCQHLPVIRKEDEYVLFLNVGNDFDVKNFYLMQPDGTGRGYVCDVVVPRNTKVTLYYPNKFDGKPGKGLTREYFLKKVGKCGWSWSYVAEWNS